MTAKNVLVIGLIAALVLLLPLSALKVLAVFNVALLVFHLLVRKSLAFKPYFLSRFNLFSANFHQEFQVEIPAELAFEKICEVVAANGFKLVVVSKDRMEVLAIAGTSWKSWGENIYFRLYSAGDTTMVRFDSAALFQIYTWGKNEDNYRMFFKQLDDSFII